MDNSVLNDYLAGKASMDDVYKNFEEDVYNAIMDYAKNHHLQFEISIAWDDDDEFEHEGYYDNVDDAIAALMKYKEIGK